MTSNSDVYIKFTIKNDNHKAEIKRKRRYYLKSLAAFPRAKRIEVPPRDGHSTNILKWRHMNCESESLCLQYNPVGAGVEGCVAIINILMNITHSTSSSLLQ